MRTPGKVAMSGVGIALGLALLAGCSSDSASNDSSAESGSAEATAEETASEETTAESSEDMGSKADWPGDHRCRRRAIGGVVIIAAEL
jgi:hypothetical protein